MRLPDGTILMHGRAPYDPVKAHEYYIRTRKLKGRKKAGEKPKSPTKIGGRAVVTPTDTKGPTFINRSRPTSFTVKLPDGSSVKLSPKQLAEQQAYAAKRVHDIKAKLADLGKELKKRISEAKAAEAKSNKPPSAADKAQAARDAKKYRDKHQQELSNKRKAADSKKATSSKPKADPVGDLQRTIAKVQGSLKAAVERQRSLTSATKNG